MEGLLVSGKRNPCVALELEITFLTCMDLKLSRVLQYRCREEARYTLELKVAEEFDITTWREGWSH
jgi:hypothetical protein